MYEYNNDRLHYLISKRRGIFYAASRGNTDHCDWLIAIHLFQDAAYSFLIEPRWNQNDARIIRNREHP